MSETAVKEETKTNTLAKEFVSMDGNSAASYVAYAFSDVAAIYPITPSSPMGEIADEYAAKGMQNVFGNIPEISELQSEGGASGSVHGALVAGAMTTTFTASQGLLLMIPNMFKIAGELTPTVFHVSARSVAAQALSIFGDHSDVMACRSTGFAMLASANVQEAQDLAAVAHLATVKSRIPFLHYFDGFRTSHEIQKIERVSYETLGSMIDMDAVEAHRQRGLNPDQPKLKGTAQNPDVFFQGREAVNNYYQKTPAIVEECMAQYAEATGREYHAFDYLGAADADKVIISMCSSVDTIEHTVKHLNENGEKVGLIKVRLYRPFSAELLIKALPGSVKKIAVLDRTKEPGSIGEPLYLDVISALTAAKKGLIEGISFDGDPLVIGGRYGLSSKEFTPEMVKAIYDELGKDNPMNSFTVGINDDVSNLSLSVGESLEVTAQGTISCKFYGLGSDGTVGANKNSIKIIGDSTKLYAQGYFVYDSKKSGGVTVSHLRFGPEQLFHPYLINSADFIAVHKQSYLGVLDVLDGIKNGGTFLLNSNFGDEAFARLPEDLQQIIIDKKIKFYNINAVDIAMEVGLGERINMIMQTAFFKLSGVLPEDEAIDKIKESIKKTYGKKGDDIVQMNINAVDKTLANLKEIPVPAATVPCLEKCGPSVIEQSQDEFVKNIIKPISMQKGDNVPVSQMVKDGEIPTGTTALEKRNIAVMLPQWKHENCIQCGQCSLVCPHAAIRITQQPADKLKDKPSSFVTIDSKPNNEQNLQFKVQLAPDDCTGCGSCANVCPAPGKALVMIQNEEIHDQEEVNWSYFTKLPKAELGNFKKESIKGSQFQQPLFEFSGACAGCGETPYVKLITQLFGERMVIANATGCSSIYGGTFPTVPYTKNEDGRGPAWANSLFEDNAEFGFGMRLAYDNFRQKLISDLGKTTTLDDLKDSSLARIAGEIVKKKNDKDYIESIRKDFYTTLDDLDLSRLSAESRKLIESISTLKENVSERSVWVVGGDGWAYDIGYGGLDHVLASGRNINVLVLDTEVYSNTGGQASKATPKGAIAKFAAAGKPIKKKDLGLMAMSYGYVYVAKVALGANMQQTINAFKEAEAYDGPSIVIAYSPCIAHGLDMGKSIAQEKKAVESGYWMLYRFNPMLEAEGKNPLSIDSREPKFEGFQDHIMSERRFSSLTKIFPERAEKFFKEYEDEQKEVYSFYQKLKTLYDKENQ